MHQSLYSWAQNGQRNIIVADLEGLNDIEALVMLHIATNETMRKGTEITDT